MLSAPRTAVIAPQELAAAAQAYASAFAPSIVGADTAEMVFLHWLAFRAVARLARVPLGLLAPLLRAMEPWQLQSVPPNHFYELLDEIGPSAVDLIQDALQRRGTPYAGPA